MLLIGLEIAKFLGKTYILLLHLEVYLIKIIVEALRKFVWKVGLKLNLKLHSLCYDSKWMVVGC